MPIDNIPEEDQTFIKLKFGQDIIDGSGGKFHYQDLTCAPYTQIAPNIKYIFTLRLDYTTWCIERWFRLGENFYGIGFGLFKQHIEDPSGILLMPDDFQNYKDKLSEIEL